MDDQALLTKYSTQHDADAFEALVLRHASFVKAVSLRVLHNSHDAEEVTQECFLELARHAAEIHTSIIGWLHRTATSRSLNLLRSRARRKARERVVSVRMEADASVDGGSMIELQRMIDGSLKELPDDLRLPMLLHYVDGQSQREVALALGVNQSTISRRVQDALRQLRDKLTQAGYVAVAPAMVALTPESAAFAAGDPIVSHATVSETAAKTAGAATLLSWLKATIAAALPVVSYLFFGGWIALIVAMGMTLTMVWRRPIWMKSVFASLGVPNVYAQPTFCLSRWNWMTPPENWRMQGVSSLAWSMFFLGISVAFASGTDHPVWGVVLLGILAAGVCIVHAVRLVHRVRAIGKRVPRNAVALGSVVGRNRNLIVRVQQIFRFAPLERTLSWLDAVQLIAIGAASIGITGQLLLDPQPRMVWPSVVLAGFLGSGMLLTGIRLCQRMLKRERVVVCSKPLRTIVSIKPALALSFRNRVVVERPVPAGHRSVCEIGETICHDEPAMSCADEKGSLVVESSSSSQMVLSAGVAVIVGLSAWIVWNPNGVRGLSLSLAAIQTSILGWMVYRLADYCRRFETKVVENGGAGRLDPPCKERPRIGFSVVRRLAVILLISCFVLNSGVCLANWLR